MTNRNDASGRRGGAVVALKVTANERRTIIDSNRPRRLHARPVKRILDRESGDVVGWLYEWNTGELVPRWKDGARSDVVYD